MGDEIMSRGTMWPEDKRKLQENTTFLEDEVDGGDLLTVLFSNNIIDEHDVEDIAKKPTGKGRTNCLLGTIRSRGPKAYYAFIFALISKGYERAAKRLQGYTYSNASSPMNSRRNIRHSSINLAERKDDTSDHDEENSRPKFNMALKRRLKTLENDFNHRLQMIENHLTSSHDDAPTKKNRPLPQPRSNKKGNKYSENGNPMKSKSRFCTIQ